MENNKVVNKYIIVKDLKFSDFMKDEKGNIHIYPNLERAQETCGMYEFENVLILKVECNYIE